MVCFVHQAEKAIAISQKPVFPHRNDTLSTILKKRTMFKLPVMGIVLLLGGCTFLSKTNLISPSLPEVKPILASTPSNLEKLELSVYQQVNEYRKSKNLPLLKLDPNISEQSRIHSYAMANGKVAFGHGGAEARFQKISQFVPWREIAENVAFNSGYVDPGKEAVKGWIESPGHQRNMVGNFDLTGVGIVKNAKGEYYFTQIFVRKK
ncbi:Allergen V5/Tpx-1-like protein [Planktothrix sp. PCC 11201]|uniref:CAP domain-containing protein n=1 Tax=Planktothrix sp. PCC 11201 TaxID=1729650 RepID=UPI0009201DE7|nr:CAP domain-containing protein [Planktothrix sp. PCC 11201]SKB14434.1 Allergen V5/Tpx-1-like protein [Planktothrix sp. PCC 11201]